MLPTFLMRLCFVALVAALVWWIVSIFRKSDQRRTASITLLVTIVLLAVLGQSQYVFLTEPLVEAAREGNYADVNRLLNLGADVDSVNDDGVGTPLIAAAAEDHPNVVALLIQRGANVNKASEYVFISHSPLTPLEAAKGHPEIIAMLKKVGATE